MGRSELGNKRKRIKTRAKEIGKRKMGRSKKREKWMIGKLGSVMEMDRNGLEARKWVRRRDMGLDTG